MIINEDRVKWRIEQQLNIMALVSIDLLGLASKKRIIEGPAKPFLQRWKNANKVRKANEASSAMSRAISRMLAVDALRKAGKQGSEELFTRGENFRSVLKRELDLLFEHDLIYSSYVDGNLQLQILESCDEEIFFDIRDLYDYFTRYGTARRKKLL